MSSASSVLPSDLVSVEVAAQQVGAHPQTSLTRCTFPVLYPVPAPERGPRGETGRPRLVRARKWVVPSAWHSASQDHQGHVGWIQLRLFEASVVVQERQVLAHEARPRIGRPREQGRAGGIGSMAYEARARNCSEKKLNSGKIAATLSRADRSYTGRASTSGSRLKPLRR